MGTAHEGDSAKMEREFTRELGGSYCPCGDADKVDLGFSARVQGRYQIAEDLSTAV